jgi:seryl-tRNA synthetase
MARRTMWMCGLVLTVTMSAFMSPVWAVTEAPKAVDPDAEPDPLVVERDALRKEADGLRAKADSFQQRQNAMRLSLKDAAKASRSLADIVTEDEETTALKERFKALEVELQQVREALKARIAENPEMKARQARVTGISSAMRELRKDRAAFEKAGTATMRRLKVVEATLAERERLAAAAAAAAAGEGAALAGETNGVSSVSEEDRVTGAAR